LPCAAADEKSGSNQHRLAGGDWEREAGLLQEKKRADDGDTGELRGHYRLRFPWVEKPSGEGFPGLPCLGDYVLRLRTKPTTQMTARTTMAIQSRLTNAAVAWNKSQRTKRITAATIRKWINLAYLQALL